MSTYQELRGLKVKYLAADPDPAAAGDVWYDGAAFALKGFVGRAAWSAASNLVVATRSFGACGTQTAALGFGGFTTDEVATSYEYDGSGWAAS